MEHKRKKQWILIIMLLLTVCSVFVVYAGREWMFTNPFKPYTFSSVSYASGDGDGCTYVIDDSNRKILKISADGRLLWRVMDNLLSNACKYAQSGTRVYIDLKQNSKETVISVKNISKNRLNIDASELMERFVRGDSSRNTQGSGLGLNIAKSLIEIQNGSFDISIDGDLFKAEIRLKN